MNKVSFRRIRQFRKDETGGMTVEFVLLFPLLLMTFVYFMGYAYATMRSAMILDHAQQSARAYSIGYFVDEADLKSHLDTYLWNVSAAKDVSTDKLPAPSATVTDAFGYVTIHIDIPMSRLISVLGYASIFEHFLNKNTQLEVRAPIEGRP